MLHNAGKTERHLLCRSKETIKNARHKLEVPMEAAMPCKTGTRKRAWKLLETAARQKPKPSNVFPSVGRRQTVSKEVRETAAR